MILIVDDKKENILPLKKILELNKFDVDFAESGEEALRKLLKQTYSLVILDVQMPGMDGYEVASLVSGHSKSKDTPIIFLSAVNKEKTFVTKGYESGGIDYITKPVDPDILLLKVKTFHKLYEQKRELKITHDLLSKEIEARKHAQENLAIQMKELNSVLKALPQIAFTIARDGEIVYVNEQWYDYSENKTFPQTHPEDQAVCEAWNIHFSKGMEFNSEIRLKHPSTNIYRYFLMKIIPVIVNDIALKWVGTLTDIETQKQNELQKQQLNELLELKIRERTKELLEKNEELEFSNHELQQFAWVVSHDLREPLRKIQTFNKIVKDRFLNNNQEAVMYLDKSINSAARMSQLIVDLLNYSRLSADSEFITTDLNILVNEALSDIEHLIESSKAILVNHNLGIIKCIPSQIRQVFQNIIVNAIEFAKKEVLPIIEINAVLIAKKEVEAEEDMEGKFCRITIRDNGIGFNEIYLDKIFTIFQSLNRSGNDGTGVGLAIVKKIIEKHNGLITAKSKEGEGSSFIIVLPV